MRLERHLSEGRDDVRIYSADDLVKIGDTLKKDCAPWLKEFNFDRQQFYRGTDKRMDDMFKMAPRRDRTPKDMDPDTSEWLNKWSKKRFGWNWRSEGVFTSDYPAGTYSFGSTTYVFFPIGKYRYIYNKNINDIMDEVVDFDDIENYEKGDQLEVRAEYFLNNILPEYTNKGLGKQTKQSNSIEVVWDCKEYYMVNSDYLTQLQDYIMRGRVPDYET